MIAICREQSNMIMTILGDKIQMDVLYRVWLLSSILGHLAHINYSNRAMDSEKAQAVSKAHSPL